MIHLSTYAPYQPNHRLSSGLVTQSQISKMNRNSDWNSTSPHEEPHWEVIERILYVYYKTHVSQEYAEMDTFYCFNNLMTEIHPNFLRKLDGSHEAGLGGQMKILSDLLSKFDNNLSKHFKKIELVPEHFAFRWLSLLLAREFMLPGL
ncbi:putative tbc1 domain family member [Schistosoma mansoni]|uniref:putative tbc1 domain family member n=1 Tax=Schistosoma mansoni TaxID=6183 RepID=UPI00022DBFE6|nr:putative tbc1 domain family member [Schistosoma mansoni]|eukprot:XP_018648520.1 putative tbc1 domain family member [Schistosoma mansoni]